MSNQPKHHSAEILVVRTDGALVLQHRDDKPGIVNPGMITSFGGTMEPGESALEGAVRELSEETSLELQAQDLQPFMDVHQPPEMYGFTSIAHYFITRPVDTDGIKIYEGQGYKVVTSLAAATNVQLTPAARIAVAAYFDRRPVFGQSTPLLSTTISPAHD